MHKMFIVIPPPPALSGTLATTTDGSTNKDILLLSVYVNILPDEDVVKSFFDTSINHLTLDSTDDVRMPSIDKE